ncbi:MAG: DUF4352 domain-containing protein [Candidatus Nanoarchaeia archaeon]|jgi:hypothetical protein
MKISIFWIVVIIILIGLVSDSDSKKYIDISPLETQELNNLSIRLESSTASPTGTVLNKYYSNSIKQNVAIVEITIKNIGKTSKYINSDKFKLLDDHGNIYDCINNDWISQNDYSKYVLNGYSDVFSDYLQPLESEDIDLLFEIPNTITYNIKLRYYK